LKNLSSLAIKSWLLFEIANFASSLLVLLSRDSSLKWPKIVDVFDFSGKCFICLRIRIWIVCNFFMILWVGDESEMNA